MTSAQDLDDLCGRLNETRPAWVSGGSLSDSGTHFLAEAVVGSNAGQAVEIGTATGFSTAVLASALALRGDDFYVSSFDLYRTWNRDESRAVGDAAREIVPELMDHISFLTEKTCADISDRFEPGTVDFLFIDANHGHPFPALDLLVPLDRLAPGAIVVLDDINLPVIHPQFEDWGAHHLFYELQVEKVEGAFHQSGHAGMGLFRLPVDVDSLRSQLLKIVESHEWQYNVPLPVLDQIGLTGQR